MTVQVLAVGMPRTGTQSMHDALEILGYRTLHEAFRQVDGPSVDAGPHDAAEERFRAYPDYEALTESHYWRLYHKAHPTAKVILTKRDPDDWFRSIEAHVDAIHSRQETTDYRDIEQADREHERLFGSRWPLKTLWTERYIQHNLLVQATCEPLLIFDVTREGWEPLCGYLERPVPDLTFPWRNRLITEEATES